MAEINVGLYGGKSVFGGKEKRLEASVIHCENYNNCSFYQEGTCLAVRSMLSPSCEFGKASTVVGYTSKAKKYYDFKNKWKNHENYNKLKYPSKKLGVINENIIFNYSYIGFIEESKGVYKLCNPYLSSESTVFTKEEFTPELIKRICSFQSQAMFGRVIDDYQLKEVPLFLANLSETLPELYEKFVSEYPEYNKEIDHRGRKAYLKTINPSEILYKSSGYSDLNSKWYWNGVTLEYIEGYVSSVNVIKNYEVSKFEIKPTDKTTITITDNNQVNNTTKFVD